MGKIVGFQRKKGDCTTFIVKMLYLNDMQFAAVEGLIPMTQEIFDSIMKQRDRKGEVLDKISENVFLKYPEFGKNYAVRLENEIELSDNISPLKLQLLSERIKKFLRRRLKIDL